MHIYPPEHGRAQVAHFPLQQTLLAARLPLLQSRKYPNFRSMDLMVLQLLRLSLHQIRIDHLLASPLLPGYATIIAHQG